MALCSKDIQTETNYVVSVCIFFSRFEGTRGYINQILRTLDDTQAESSDQEFWDFKYRSLASPTLSFLG